MSVLVNYIKSSKWFLVSLFIVIAFGFGDAIGNGQSMDDEFVFNEQTAKGISNYKKLLTSHYYDIDGQAGDYRPVTTLSFALEADIFGQDESTSHLVNLIIYLFVCIAVHAYLRQLFKSEFLISAAILLFAAHPLHVEVVASLKNRDELLSALFGFMAVVIFIRMKDYSLKNIHKWVLVTLLLMLSIASKKSGFIYIPIIILSQLYIEDRPIKAINALLFAFPLFITKFLLRKSAILTTETRNFIYHENPLYTMDSTLLDRFPIGAAVIFKYVGLFLLPYPLRYYYGYDQVELHGWSSATGFFSAVVLIALVGLIAYFWKKKHPAIFGLAFFLGTGAIFSNLVTPMPGIVAERFVFVPILGLCILVAAALVWLTDKIDLQFPSARWAFVFVPVGVLCLTSFNRVQDWESRMTLYEADIPHLNNSAKANFMYALQLLHTEQTKPNPDINTVNKALLHFNKAKEIYPGYKEAYNNAAWMNITYFGNLQVANQLFNQAIAIDSTYPEPVFGKGFIAHKQGRIMPALELFKKAYKLDPKKMYNAKYRECDTYMQLKDGPNLINAAREGIRDGHIVGDTYIFLGNGFLFEAQFDSALYYYVESYKIQPSERLCSEIMRLATNNNRETFLQSIEFSCQK